MRKLLNGFKIVAWMLVCLICFLTMAMCLAFDRETIDEANGNRKEYE